MAYAEIVENSFPGLRPYLRTLRMMPLKLEIEAEFHNRRRFEDVTLSHRRWPVASYGEAGASVAFPETKSNFFSADAIQAYIDKTDALLTRFGRYFVDRVVSTGGTRVPDFLGNDTSFDGLPDESAVVRAAMDLLKDDLKYLFAEVPTYHFRQPAGPTEVKTCDNGCISPRTNTTSSTQAVRPRMFYRKKFSHGASGPTT